MHMVAVAARIGCERAMVGTGWATSCPDCMDRLRKHYSHLVGGWFLARKAAWALSRCMITYSADYCMLVNESVLSKSRVCLLRLQSRHRFSFGVRAWTEQGCSRLIWSGQVSSVCGYTLYPRGTWCNLPRKFRNLGTMRLLLTPLWD